MKTIKTRQIATGIKVLNKPANLSKRMKDSYVRTKGRAEETKESPHSSPTEYAVNSIQDKAKGAAEQAVRHLPNPRHKAQQNIEKVNKHFQEVKRQLPKERNRAAEQAQKTANKAKGNADSLRKTADQAKKTANEAKKTVKDAKQTLKKVRQDGRQTVRNAKQSVKSRRGVTESPKTAKPSGANPVKSPTGGKPAGNISRPGYLNKGVQAQKGATNTAKTAEKSVKGAKSAAKGVKATAKGTVKTAKKSVKTAEKSAKAAVKTAKQAAKTAQKTAKVAAKSAKAAAKAAKAATKVAVKAAKVAVKAAIALVKAAIAAIKGLVAAIAAGGWIAVLIIVIVCLIALIVGSIFGIFFSSEPDPGTGQTVNGVIAEINDEYTGQIDATISGNAHDLLDMSGARAGWKNVLAVYAVRTVSDPDNPMEVATMNDEKAAILRAVFWDMNAISHTLDTFDVEEDILDNEGLPTGETETVTKTVLRITVSNKAPDEMAALYGFDAGQKEWLEELLKPEYHSLWNALLYGITSIGDGTMIEIADTQIGNVGGEVFWRWYGFGERVEWCAIFVSWVAEHSGLIEAGVIPRFSSCAVGIQWFQDCDQWADSGYVPRPGDLIFFDWEPDGVADHVGIVESVVDGKVNTIEGNSSDSVRRRSYDIDSIKIYGYGVPIYQ